MFKLIAGLADADIKQDILKKIDMDLEITQGTGYKSVIGQDR